MSAPQFSVGAVPPQQQPMPPQFSVGASQPQQLYAQPQQPYPQAPEPRAPVVSLKDVNLRNQHLRIIVKFVEARNLAPKDRGGTSDPYPRLRLGTKKKWKGRKLNKTLNPVFNQTATIQIDSLKKKLYAEVWDGDWFSMADFEGRVVIDPAQLPVCTNPAHYVGGAHVIGSVESVTAARVPCTPPLTTFWSPLTPRSKDTKKQAVITGDLCLSVCAHYVPVAEYVPQLLKSSMVAKAPNAFINLREGCSLRQLMASLQSIAASMGGRVFPHGETSLTAQKQVQFQKTVSEGSGEHRRTRTVVWYEQWEATLSVMTTTTHDAFLQASTSNPKKHSEFTQLWRSLLTKLWNQLASAGQTETNPAYCAMGVSKDTVTIVGEDDEEGTCLIL